MIASGVLPCFAAPPAKPSPAKKKIAVWKVNQWNSFGAYTVYATPSAIRIDGATGGTMVAAAPDWTVYFFNKKDKTKNMATFKVWSGRYETPPFRITRLRQHPAKTVIGGIAALSYTININKIGDSDDGFSSLYQTKHSTELVKYRRVSIAENPDRIPQPVIDIWRSQTEIPTAGSLPLESYDVFASGRKVYNLKTISQSDITVEADFFEHKLDGYKKGGSAFVVFYGSETGAAAEMMLPMD